MLKFSTRLKELRTDKNITQKQLANALNVNTRTISYWEASKREPNLLSLMQLAMFFEVTTDYLLGLED